MGPTELNVLRTFVSKTAVVLSGLCLSCQLIYPLIFLAGFTGHHRSDGLTVRYIQATAAALRSDVTGVC